MEIGEKITASEGKVFRLIHNQSILGEELYVGNVWIDGVETPFSMELIEEVDILIEPTTENISVE